MREELFQCWGTGHHRPSAKSARGKAVQLVATVAMVLSHSSCVHSCRGKEIDQRRTKACIRAKKIWQAEDEREDRIRVLHKGP